MYTFEAIYLNMDTNAKRRSVITIDTDIIDGMTRRDAFFMGLGQAYDRKQDDEILITYEFINA